MNPHKKGKRIILGVSFLTCLCIASYGLLVIINLPEKEITLCNTPGPNDRPQSGIEVKDRMINIITQSPNSTKIRYLWFDLEVNSSLSPDASYFMSYDSSLGSSNGFYCHL